MRIRRDSKSKYPHIFKVFKYVSFFAISIFGASIPHFAAGAGCEYFFDGDHIFPAFLQKLLTSSEGAVIEVCPEDRYQLIWPAVISREGVCVVVSRRIDKKNGDLTELGTRMYVIGNERKCPSINSGLYVETKGVSIGVFISVIKLMENLFKDNIEYGHGIDNISASNLSDMKNLMPENENFVKYIVGIYFSQNIPERDFFISVVISLGGVFFSINIDLLGAGFNIYSVDVINFD